MSQALESPRDPMLPPQTYESWGNDLLPAARGSVLGTGVSPAATAVTRWLGDGLEQVLTAAPATAPIL